MEATNKKLIAVFGATEQQEEELCALQLQASSEFRYPPWPAQGRSAWTPAARAEHT